MSDEEKLAEYVRVRERHPTTASAAIELGIPRTTLQDALQRAKRLGITADWVPPKVDPEQPEDLSRIERLLMKGASIEQMQSATGATVGAVLDEIDRLHHSGKQIVRRGDVFKIEKTPPIGNHGDHISFTTDNNNRIKLGLSSDKHYGSKYAREDVIEELYDWFYNEGVTAVIDAGNYIDGESSFNKYDLKVHGLDAQVQYLVEKLPVRDGIVTYAVSGDDHEGWYAKREGVDIGRYVESTFHQNGRYDWVNIGYMEAYFGICNANTGATSVGLVMHPGGGSSYAQSYRPQKIVEGFSGGEKPALLLIGHYHKMSVNLIRNVWTIQCGTAQDSTPFMRKKGIESHIGGIIVELEQDPETGALVSCKPEMRRYFNAGYYNGRWSPYGQPTYPAKVVNMEP